MLTKLGIDFDTKLKDKPPYERFFYILMSMKKAAQDKNEDVSFFDKRNIRKILKTNLGLKSHQIIMVETDKIEEMQIYQELARLAQVDVDVLLKDSKLSHLLNPKQEEPVVAKVRKPRTAKQDDGGAQPSSDVVFENCTDFHLSLDITGRHIKIYLNELSPKTAKHVLLSSQSVKVGDKDVKRTFPETIKIE